MEIYPHSFTVLASPAFWQEKGGVGVCVCVKMSPDFLFAKNVGYCHVVLKPILIEGE